MMKKIILSNIIIIIFINSLFSQVFSDYLYTGYEAVTSAGSVVAKEGGGSSPFHNPSGLAEINTLQINTGYSNLFNLHFLPYSNWSMLLPTNFGNIGFSYQGISVEYQGNKLITEQAIGFSQGFYAQNDRNSTLSIGYTVNYLYINQGETITGEKLGSDGTVGLDLGIQATFRERHRIGAFIKNINNPSISDSFLPKRLNIGMAYSPYHGVMTSFTVSRLFGSSSTQYMSSLNYDVNKILSLSTGFQSNPNRIGAGFQLYLKNYEFGYGLLTHHVMPITHQISFGLRVD